MGAVVPPEGAGPPARPMPQRDPRVSADERTGGHHHSLKADRAPPRPGSRPHQTAGSREALTPAPTDPQRPGCPAAWARRTAAGGSLTQPPPDPHLKTVCEPVQPPRGPCAHPTLCGPRSSGLRACRSFQPQPCEKPTQTLPRSGPRAEAVTLGLERQLLRDPGQPHRDMEGTARSPGILGEAPRGGSWR